MKIAIGADHRGHASARAIADRLTAQGHQVSVMGPLDGKSCDYPERAFLVGRAVSGKQADLGVCICGTGIGMAIAANKVKGVRAAVVHDEMTAQLYVRLTTKNWDESVAARAEGRKPVFRD